MSSAQVSLPDLMQGLGGVQFGDPSGVVVRSIATDSRRVGQDCLFVALGGTHTHGRHFVPAALARGACALLLPLGSDPPAGVPGFLHPSPEAILAELATRLYARPGDDLRLYGVTGTNGKTTTALLLASLLAACGEPTAFWTTTLVRVGPTEFRPKWTTPPAHELQRFLRTARDLGQRSVVMEVTSHAVKLGRIGGLRYAAGIATNISPDHLDFHPDFADYLAAKRSFIAGLDEGAAAFLCADDPLVLGFRSAARCATFTFGLSQGADIGAEDVRTQPGILAFNLHLRSAELRRRFGTTELSLSLPMCGRYNVMNALSALGIGIWAGISPDAARTALAQFAPPPRRLELQRIGPFTVLNDVAMNEVSYDAVLAAVKDLGHRPVVLVHAPRGQRGAELNARIARILSRWNEELCFSPLIVSLSRGELSHYAVDHQVQDEELAALVDAAAHENLPMEVHSELQSAVGAGVERLLPGGVLVLLGTFGMDDGPALAEAMLTERLGGNGTPAEHRYLEPSDGSF